MLKRVKSHTVQLHSKDDQQENRSEFQKNILNTMANYRLLEIIKSGTDIQQISHI